MLTAYGCGTDEQQRSDSGVTKASVTVKTDADGHTAEQRNMIDRNTRDNDLGAIKHLYIISSYTGDVLEYSTVRGKVTSGNKRLTPRTVDSKGSTHANYVNIGGTSYLTDEVLDEGGAMVILVIICIGLTHKETISSIIHPVGHSYI
jgi:hypothetical protein